MLTRKQRELLMFIHEKMEETGIPPSFDEMKDALELASKSGIHRLITALEERGFIRRLANRARALEVIKLPEPRTTIAGDHILAKQKAIGVNKTTQQRTTNVEGYNKVPPMAVIGSVEIPVMGRIAAGVPISAIQHKTHSITMPIDLVGNGEHYALEVKGDSMVEAGIYDGDTVIIRRTSTATNGEIVVALIDDEEATLKRYKREGDKFIALEAANPAYETRYIPPCRISIQGKLVGLFRSY